MWGWPGPLLGALRPCENLVSCPPRMAPARKRSPERGVGVQACGPGSSTPVSGETPDGWPCLADPDWASYTLGVFICLSCSGIHRNIPHVSKVKSVRLDTWEDVQVEVWQGRGGRWGCLPAARRPQTQPGAGGVPARCHSSLRPSPQPSPCRPLPARCPGNPHGPLVVRASWVTHSESQKVTGARPWPAVCPQSPGPTPASVPTQSPHVP